MQLQRLAGTTAAAAAEAAGTSKTTDGLARSGKKKSTMSLYIVVPSEAGFTTIYFSRV